MTNTDSAVTAIAAGDLAIAPTKPGWKTSEFWLTLAAKALGSGALVGIFGDGSPAVRVGGLATIVLAQLGYTASRAWVKGGAQ